ncbi:unnamed protein product, partial [Symbiodinium microadriaticum]
DLAGSVVSVAHAWLIQFPAHDWRGLPLFIGSAWLRWCLHCLCRRHELLPRAVLPRAGAGIFLRQTQDRHPSTHRVGT